eukprot:scaffold15231_cov66-Cyclotella_meneghiniana.AAC.2
MRCLMHGTRRKEAGERVCLSWRDSNRWETWASTLEMAESINLGSAVSTIALSCEWWVAQGATQIHA